MKIEPAPNANPAGQQEIIDQPVAWATAAWWDKPQNPVWMISQNAKCTLSARRISRIHVMNSRVSIKGTHVTPER